MQHAVVGGRVVSARRGGEVRAVNLLERGVNLRGGGRRGLMRREYGTLFLRYSII
jgi:hypothetical protein